MVADQRSTKGVSERGRPYEEQWNATGSLSDRHRNWIERQLDGTWRAVGSNRRPETTVTPDPAPTDEAALLDAMIERRLAAQGKTLVDAERIDRLRQAVSGLNDALAGLGA